MMLASDHRSMTDRTTIRPNGPTVAVYYVHANHLNAPITVTQPSSNKIARRWDNGRRR